MIIGMKLRYPTPNELLSIFWDVILENAILLYNNSFGVDNLLFFLRKISISMIVESSKYYMANLRGLINLKPHYKKI